MKKTLLAICVAALLATPATAQVDFTRYVALGDSLTAGFASGSLMDYYQNRSYPALLAAQGGMSAFQMPLIAPPGLAPIMVLDSLSPLSLGMTDLAPPMDPLDYFYNVQLEEPYQNLGIPGADTHDLVATTGNIFNLLAGNQDNVMFDLILRTPEYQGIPFTAQAAAIGQQPTLVTVWIGNNDILGALVSATPIEGITMTPVQDFATDYATLIGGLATMLPSTDIVILPVFGDARWVPFATAFPPAVEIPGMGVVPLVGEDGPLVLGQDYLTLPAAELVGQGFGLPVPGAPPLPENLDLATGAPGVVLRAAEITAINERIAAFNATIAATASAFPNVHLYDVNELFVDIFGGTYKVFGGVTLTADFLTGGIFSYDGVHPQNIGQAVVADGLIDFFNQELGANLPALNWYRTLTEGDWQGASALNKVCPQCDPREAVMPRNTFMQLYEIFLPEMAARWQHTHFEAVDVTAAID